MSRMAVLVMAASISDAPLIVPLMVARGAGLLAREGNGGNEDALGATRGSDDRGAAQRVRDGTGGLSVLGKEPTVAPV